MANYEEARIKLSNIQLNKSKSTAENKTGTTLRINKKHFQDQELPHELILTTRKRTKISAFAKNMSTYIKISKSQLSIIFEWSGFLGWMIGYTICNFGKKCKAKSCCSFG